MAFPAPCSANEKIIHVSALKIRLLHLLSTLTVICCLASLAWTTIPIRSAYAAGSKTSESAGGILFRDKGCAYCHGANLQGTQKGPSLINIRQKVTAAQMTDQIVNGGMKMPSFEDTLSKDEIAQLIAFLRAKHPPIAPPLPTPVPAPAPVSNPGQ